MLIFFKLYYDFRICLTPFGIKHVCSHKRTIISIYTAVIYLLVKNFETCLTEIVLTGTNVCTYVNFSSSEI